MATVGPVGVNVSITVAPETIEALEALVAALRRFEAPAVEHHFTIDPPTADLAGVGRKINEAIAAANRQGG